MKITNEKLQNGQKNYRELVERAHNSESFKVQLLTKPEEAIKQVLGKNFTLPKGRRILVEDQTDEDKIYLNIPSEPNLDELELSEEQLEQVAGGITPTFIVLGIVVVFGGGGYATAAALDTN